MWSAPWLVFRKWGDMVFKKGISICWFQNQHGRSQFLNFWTSYLEQEFDMYPGSNHFYNAIYQTCCRNGLPLSSSTLLLHWIRWGPVTEHMLSVIYIRTTTCQNGQRRSWLKWKASWTTDKSWWCAPRWILRAYHPDNDSEQAMCYGRGHRWYNAQWQTGLLWCVHQNKWKTMSLLRSRELVPCWIWSEDATRCNCPKAAPLITAISHHVNDI